MCAQVARDRKDILNCRNISFRILVGGKLKHLPMRGVIHHVVHQHRDSNKRDENSPALKASVRCVASCHCSAVSLYANSLSEGIATSSSTYPRSSIHESKQAKLLFHRVATHRVRVSYCVRHRAVVSVCIIVRNLTQSCADS